MQELLPDIFMANRDESSGGWGYSYFVKRPEGNILFARMAQTASIENEYEAIQHMGGIQRIYITDYHFAGEHVEDVAQKFNAGIYCSQIEAPKIKKRGIDSVVAFEFVEHEIEPQLSVIPTPGHTSGGVCYLLTLNEKRYLFTGDFLNFDGRNWIVGSKTYAKVQASLDRLQNLDYDVLVGCGDASSGIPYIELTPETKDAFFDSIVKSFDLSSVRSKSLDKTPIIWQDQIIGYIEDMKVDNFHWYGKWLPLNTPETQDFLSTIKTGKEVLVQVGTQKSKRRYRVSADSFSDDHSEIDILPLFGD